MDKNHSPQSNDRTRMWTGVIMLYESWIIFEGYCVGYGITSYMPVNSFPHKCSDITFGWSKTLVVVKDLMKSFFPAYCIINTNLLWLIWNTLFPRQICFYLPVLVSLTWLKSSAFPCSGSLIQFLPLISVIFLLCSQSIWLCLTLSLGKISRVHAREEL